jgi:hypothetical protein
VDLEQWLIERNMPKDRSRQVESRAGSLHRRTSDSPPIERSPQSYAYDRYSLRTTGST